MKKEDRKAAYNALMKVYPLTLDDLDDEQWRPVSGFDKYRISNYGRVKSFWKNKILKPANTIWGYLRVDLSDGKNIQHAVIHRLVAKAFIPNPDGKPQVNHIDGCKLNNYVGNLEWSTSLENNQHAFNTGLRHGKQGEENTHASITNEQARYIRDNPDGLAIKDLAEMFHIDGRNISAIQLGRKYKNAGGKIRLRIERRVPDEIRKEIRSLFILGSKEFGSRALGKKYGLDASTILKIVHEGDDYERTTRI